MKFLQHQRNKDRDKLKYVHVFKDYSIRVRSTYVHAFQMAINHGKSREDYHYDGKIDWANTMAGHLDLVYENDIHHISTVYTGNFCSVNIFFSFFLGFTTTNIQKHYHSKLLLLKNFSGDSIHGVEIMDSSKNLLTHVH